MKQPHHSLTERQIRQATAADGTVDWELFAALVDQAYREAERESTLRERSLRLMSDEMFGLSQNVAAEAEARFRIILDRLIEGVAITDAAGMIRTANQALAEMARAEPGELGGRAIWPLFPGITSAAALADASGPRPRGLHRRLETELRTRDGTLLPVAVTVSEFRWNNARQLVWLIYDVSARRRREKQTAETAERLRVILDNMSQGLMMLDAELRVVAYNPHFREMFNFPEELLRSRPHLSVLLRHQAMRGDYGEGDLDAQVERRLAMFARRQPLQHEIDLPGGKTLELRCNNTPEGGLVMTFTDVTERLLAVRSAQEARVVAETASRAKSDFLANMSHELRTPLNAIIGYSEAMMARLFGPIAARYAEYARDINVSGQHLLTIIGDLLDLAKIEAGRMEIVEEPLDLRALAEEVLHLMRDRAEKGGLSLTLDCRARETALIGDARAIRQILLNLVSNAIKFTVAGGAVSATIADAAAGGLELVVSDTGIGMAAQDIPKALEPFGQISGPMSRRHQGTGLGLPLVKSFAELHQARMAITSQPGMGTRVAIVFPPERRPAQSQERAHA